MIFRRDIQGLRSVAVLLVLFFHLDFSWARGGFIGVDIFFVISGFLISSIIIKSINEGSFSFISFYKKRAKRLLPALFVVIIATIGIGYFILLPKEATDLSGSVFSTLLYYSNYYFFSQSGYFSDDLHTSPLLHTWSLSVEEQFYLVFPLFCVLIHKTGKLSSIRFVLVCTLLLLVSSIAIWGASKDAAFYWSPARFWQFFCGYLAFVYVNNGNHTKYASLASVIGLILIISSAVYLPPNGTFTTILSIIPTVGAFILLIAGAQNTKKNMVTTLLENPAFTTLGNISYSVYLWHWPLIVYFKLRVYPELYFSAQIKIFVLSLVLGYLTWFFVENQFRKPNLKKSQKLILFGLTSIIVCISSIVVTTSGLPQRFSDTSNYYSTFTDNKPDGDRMGTCFITSANSENDFDAQQCISIDKDKSNILLIGDSHAAHLYQALKTKLDKEASISQINASGCAPTIAYIGEKRCTRLMRFTFEELIPRNQFDNVIISARWEVHKVDALQETLDLVKQYSQNVTLVGPNVSYPLSLPKLLIFNSDTELVQLQVQGLERANKIEGNFKTIPLDSQIQYFSILNKICNNDKCRTIAHGSAPLLWDRSHFTNEGAAWIVEEMKKQGIF